MFPILIRNDWIAKWPRYGEQWVVPAQAATAFCMIELGHHVGNFRVVRQGLESVGKAARNKQHLSVVGRQLNGVPMKIRLRVWAHIYGYVKNSAARAPDQLRFFVRRYLEVQPSKCRRLVVK